jgi:hypothetical protein|tara:strand:+ start:51151 stop:51513 length:363 start_codon:yes stop_codon:yes gene_type:complete
MSQYQTGTVDVTNGSATVQGNGTTFVGNVAVGDLFIVQGSLVIYQVQSITDNDTLVLTGNYGESTDSAVNYSLTNDFTPNFSLPELSPGDLGAAHIVTRALRLIDTQMQDFEDRITALEP